MPAKSKAQADLVRAAAHGATFPLAQKIRASMTPKQMQDFSETAAPPPSTAKRKQMAAIAIAEARKHGGNRYAKARQS